MKLKRVSKILLSTALVASSITHAAACTVLLYTDAKGRAYTGRTLEFIGSPPNQMVYYPAGTRMESISPNGQAAKTFNTKHAIFAVTVTGVTPNAKQDSLHEAINDQGLTFTTNSLGGNISPNVHQVPQEKILSGLDLGVWALGNFENVAQVKRALENNEVEIWLPVVPILGNDPMPLHFGLFDRSGAGIVIEWIDGKTTVYDNPVGVMTNNPPFPWHLQNMSNFAHLTNVDKNHGQFNRLKVSSFDSGSALDNVPSIQTSPGRFVKAAFYANYAEKAKTPEQAILTLSHVMNNFDRPKNITVDVSPDLPGGERDLSNTKGSKSSSEVTDWTVLRDLSQNHFYIRTINSLNYSKFDLNKLSALKETKVISMKALDANTNLDGTHLFLQ
ncbi:MAG: linear amide C-N hydrolase [Fluviibacter sp.]